MKYALIGCGRIAVNHMKAALNNELEIVAVCDVLPEKMEEILAKYDLQNDEKSNLQVLLQKVVYMQRLLYIALKRV